MNQFFYPRQARNIFGKEGAAHPWFQVIRDINGATFIHLDFLRDPRMATTLAERANICPPPIS